MTVMPPEPSRSNPARVYYLQARSAAELRVLRTWVDEQGDPDAEQIVVAHAADDVAALADRLARDDDPLLTPISVAWLPRLRHGERVARMHDVVLEGDPRGPRPSQHALLLRLDPHRAVPAIGASATKSELRARFEAAAADPSREGDFLSYVGSRAALAMQSAQGQVHGPRYRIPRLVRDRVYSSLRFQTGLARLALELGRRVEDVLLQADRSLREMVAGYSPSQLDLSLAMGRTVTRQGYDVELDFDHEQAHRMAEQIRDSSIVLLPTHRSNFDSAVMPTAWHELGLPPTHTLAGDNMAFWPVGPIMRRSGAIFIRRDTRSDPVYRFVLREYIGYLVEKKFPLEWYIEGGRSRTGKLLPPKLGLLKYVVDAFREGRTDDVMLVPASITYDQLREVADFATEASGAPKPKENLGWVISNLRRSSGRRYGRIYVRFGEPVSLRAMLGATAQSPGVAKHDAESDLQLQKIAFEVATRINAVTPMTAAALVTLALLGGLGQALTFDQVRRIVSGLYAYAQRRGLPMTASALALDSPEGVRGALDALVSTGVVDFWGDGPEPVYRVGADQHLAAAFYRNSLIHHFLDDSIAQLALVAAAAQPGDEVTESFWDFAMRLRDLFKFEFFFRDKDAFRAGLQERLDDQVPHWQDQLTRGAGAVPEVLARFGPLTAHLTLRSFLEAYAVVAEELGSRGSDPVTDLAGATRACQGLGRQRLLQLRVRSPESVSKQLFETGLQVAGNLGLLTGGEQQSDHRAAFAEELQRLIDHLDTIEALARGDLLTLTASPTSPTATAAGPGARERVS